MTDVDPRAFVEEGFARLLRSVVQKLRAILGNRLSNDELLAAARRAIEGIRLEASGSNWASAPPCTIEQAQRVARLRQTVRIVGTIAERTAPQLLRIEESGEIREVESVCVRLMDTTGHAVWSLDVLGAELADRLDERMRSGQPTEFLAIPIALPVGVSGTKPNFSLDENRQNFFLHLLDLRPSSSVFDLLGATTDERARAEELLYELHRRGVSPIKFLHDTVIDLLGVVGVASFPLLGDLLRFSTYQALSCGHIDHASGRLHAIIPGPPGAGKKLLGLAARIQNPVTIEMSPTRASAAGLVGASHLTASGWSSTPGCVARATGGVAWLQDAHGWGPTTVRQLAPILQEIMEDGIVRDSTAGGIAREADTSLLIDLNRTRHLTAGGGQARREAALLGVRPVLSRADLLCDIPPDAERAWAVGRQMCETVGSGRQRLEQNPEVREVRLLVALLRDRHPHVDLSGIRSDLGNTYDAIHEANLEFIRTEPEAADVPARLSITFARYISAIARSNDRSVAEPSDVAEAAHYVGQKLHFLRMNTGAPCSSSWRANPDDWVARHAGKTVYTQSVREEYQRETGTTVSERTIRRAIERAGGRRVGKGHWALPPANGTDGQADSG